MNWVDEEFEYLNAISTDWSFDMPFYKMKISYSRRKPDLIEHNNRLIWEIKPITHINEKFRSKDDAQLDDYLKEANCYSAGNPEFIAPAVTGGIYIDDIVGVNNVKFEVRLYPGNRDGFLFYDLKVKTSSDWEDGNKIEDPENQAVKYIIALLLSIITRKPVFP